jgi:hypothetical protein
VVNVIGGLASVYFTLIRPWHLKWGATTEEVDRALPGDEFVPEPRLNVTHAVTIRAPLDQVWPWIAQIGQGRGGFYSYEWIENLLGADIHNADRILPEYQNPQVGDKLPLAQDGFGVPMAIVEPRRALVVHGDTRGDPKVMPGLKPGGFFNIVWGWHLDSIDAETTRLVERWRADWNPSLGTWIYMHLFLEPGAFIMERRMLLGIQRRAESNRGGGLA